MMDDGYTITESFWPASVTSPSLVADRSTLLANLPNQATTSSTKPSTPSYTSVSNNYNIHTSQAQQYPTSLQYSTSLQCYHQQQVHQQQYSNSNYINAKSLPF